VILVDTSVWVDYLRMGDSEMVSLLETDQVCSHDFVGGELACSNLRNRAEILGLLRSLPRLATATEEEALFLIEDRHLMGRGIGYIDVHPLAATLLGSAHLWTRDKALRILAEEAGRALTADAQR
jgi:predicted nucleic acid-binding protein